MSDPFEIPPESENLTEQEQVDLIKSHVYPRLVMWGLLTVMGSITLFSAFGSVLLAFKIFGD